MRETIAQRELRNRNADIIRRVEAGESFVVTRHGRPIADLVPHQEGGNEDKRWPALAEVQAEFRKLPPVDRGEWERERENDDDFFGPDDPLEDPWERASEGPVS